MASILSRPQCVKTCDRILLCSWYQQLSWKYICTWYTVFVGEWYLVVMATPGGIYGADKTVLCATGTNKQIHMATTLECVYNSRSLLYTSWNQDNLLGNKNTWNLLCICLFLVFMFWIFNYLTLVTLLLVSKSPYWSSWYLICQFRFLDLFPPGNRFFYQIRPLSGDCAVSEEVEFSSSGHSDCPRSHPAGHYRMDLWNWLCHFL